MFMFHSALALGLIALAAGCALFILGHRTDSCGKGLAKFFGVIIIIISVLSTACSLYTGAMFWKTGGFQELMKMHEMRMQNKTSPMMHDEENKPAQ